MPSSLQQKQMGECARHCESPPARPCASSCSVRVSVCASVFRWSAAPCINSAAIRVHRERGQTTPTWPHIFHDCAALAGRKKQDHVSATHHGSQAASSAAHSKSAASTRAPSQTDKLADALADISLHSQSSPPASASVSSSQGEFSSQDEPPQTRGDWPRPLNLASTLCRSALCFACCLSSHLASKRFGSPLSPCRA